MGQRGLGIFVCNLTREFGVDGDEICALDAFLDERQLLFKCFLSYFHLLLSLCE